MLDFWAFYKVNYTKTINGGTTWTLVPDIIPPNSVNTAVNNDVICGMDAVGTHTIYGCGAYFGPAYVIKSIDSGATWQYIDMSAYAESLVEIMFVDEILVLHREAMPMAGLF